MLPDGPIEIAGALTVIEPPSPMLPEVVAEQAHQVLTVHQAAVVMEE